MGSQEGNKRIGVYVLVGVCLISAIIFIGFLNQNSQPTVQDSQPKITLSTGDLQYGSNYEFYSISNYGDTISHCMTGMNWTNILDSPDSENKQRAIFLLFSFQHAINQLEYGQVLNLNPDVKINETIKINTLIENDLSKENSIKLIDNAIQMDNFYYEQGLKNAQISKNRFLYIRDQITSNGLPQILKNEKSEKCNMAGYFGGKIPTTQELLEDEIKADNIFQKNIVVR